MADPDLTPDPIDAAYARAEARLGDDDDAARAYWALSPPSPPRISRPPPPAPQSPRAGRP